MQTAHMTSLGAESRWSISHSRWIVSYSRWAIRSDRCERHGPSELGSQTIWQYLERSFLGFGGLGALVVHRTSYAERFSLVFGGLGALVAHKTSYTKRSFSGFRDLGASVAHMTSYVERSFLRFRGLNALVSHLTSYVERYFSSFGWLGAPMVIASSWHVRTATDRVVWRRFDAPSDHHCSRSGMTAKSAFSHFI